jgi:cytochrome c553
MQSVAKKLSAEDISAVASWLALQNMPADSKAISKSNTHEALGASLPLSCGSVPR